MCIRDRGGTPRARTPAAESSFAFRNLRWGLPQCQDPSPGICSFSRGSGFLARPRSVFLADGASIGPTVESPC
eukprot:2999481-Pyramimonas_sp.AAC.1